MIMKYDYEIDMSTDNSASIILRHINPGSHVLEFGPATGYMTRYMKEELGCTIFCVEIDRKAAEVAMNYSEKMIIADIDSLEWGRQLSGVSFDHIIFSDVLEHLKNPWKVLEYAVSFLKQNGNVITSIPNIGHSAVIMELLQGKFDYRPIGLLDDSHLRFFTRKSVLDLLGRAGLCPIEWLETITHPEHTEFQQKYKYFPEPLQKLLKGKEDAHVYQFVTISKRKEDLSKDQYCLELPRTNPFLNNEYLQIFWEEKGEFHESRSVKKRLAWDEGFLKYDITLPPEAHGRLRLDPGSLPAYIEVKGIMLYAGTSDITEDTNPVAIWCEENDFAGLLPGPNLICLKGQKSKKFLCINNDPQFFLENVPKTYDKQPLVLRVEMSISEDFPEHVFVEINRVQEELEEKDSQLNNQKNELIRLAAELAEKDGQLKRQMDELIRLTVQLTKKDEELSRRIDEFTRQTVELLIKDEQLGRQADELNRLTLELAEKDEQLKIILNSRSWRITRPLRWIGQVGRKIKNTANNLLEACVRRSYKPILIPLSGIQPLPDEGPGIWESVNHDPQFLINGPWPRGWTLISWLASSDNPLSMRLYLDRGRGFNETENIDIGVVNSRYLIRYSALVPFGDDLQGLRLDPGDATGRFSLSEFRMVRVNKLEVFLRAVWDYYTRQGTAITSNLYLLKKAIGVLKREGVRGLWRRAKQYISPNHPSSAVNIAEYEVWLMHHTLTEEDKQKIRNRIKEFAYQPLFSIIVPVYNVEDQWLRKCIESVLGQLYPYWELCIVDDASTQRHIRHVLDEYLAKDIRIKVAYREKNGHISAASNSALELATGDYIALLDNDDELAPEALYENALLLNEHPEADIIYSDEDKIDLDGKRQEPFFKPDWSPELFRSQMYIGHLGVYRRALVEEIGGFREGFEGSQDYDLVLRLSEKNPKIYHLPKVLYHWRKTPTSTASGFTAKPYAHDAGLEALKQHADRVFGKGTCEVRSGDHYFQYSFYFHTPNAQLVSIIIPTKDHKQLLEGCLNSILSKTTYPNFEIIIIDNNSSDPETLDYFDRITGNKKYRVRVIAAPIPFNWSRLNNIAIKEASGDFFVFLNNDVEVITPDWLEWLIGYGSRDDIGAVGPMLLYPDSTIQHAGVVIGIGGYADHVLKGYDPKYIQPFYVSPKLIRNVTAVTGACLGVSRSKIEKYGGFDEDFIICGSDVEICLRFLKFGLRNVYIPQVQLYHYESKTRDSFIPDIDFKMSKEAYAPYLIQGDPYYNPNLSLEDTHARIKLIK